jgi:hypothetical protein
MSPFIQSLVDLQDEFHKSGVPTDAPGFCDHPAFLMQEQKNPELLNNYAAFVAKRHYTKEYLHHSTKVISRASRLLHQELVRHGRLGACVDISGILSRILDLEGIWNCAIKGSSTISFPLESGLEPRYFWSCDHGEFIAGHAWIFAPPFTVVDISIGQQPYDAVETSYIPDTVLSIDTQSVKVTVQDIVSPSARSEMRRAGVPPQLHLEFGAKNIPCIFQAITPIAVPGLNGASLKYSPVAVHASDGTFKEMRNMDFNGLTPWELYEQKIQPLLRGID